MLIFGLIWRLLVQKQLIKWFPYPRFSLYLGRNHWLIVWVWMLEWTISLCINSSYILHHLLFLSDYQVYIWCMKRCRKMHKSFILHHKTDNKERFYTCNLLIHRFLMCIVQTLPGFVQISFLACNYSLLELNTILSWYRRLNYRCKIWYAPFFFP